jgi:dihydropteroate synthase
MGILNVTADSFHDGGRYHDPEDAVESARQMIAAGADIIDIGGESTRPGSRRVQQEQELTRVVPVVEAIASQTDVSISVDTSKAVVARRVLEAGAHMINDVTALKGDRKMAAVVAEAGCPVCLMHMQGKPATMQDNPVYRDVIGDIAGFLSDRAAWAESKGIARDKIIIDPGIGFGKKLEHNLEIIDHLDSFLSLGMPLMIGASRKSFLGTVLASDDSEDRLAGTVSTTVMAYEKGARIFRVHDVRENLDALRVVAAVGGRHEQ